MQCDEVVEGVRTPGMFRTVEGEDTGAQRQLVAELSHELLRLLERGDAVRAQVSVQVLNQQQMRHLGRCVTHFVLVLREPGAERLASFFVVVGAANFLEHADAACQLEKLRRQEISQHQSTDFFGSERQLDLFGAEQVSGLARKDAVSKGIAQRQLTRPHAVQQNRRVELDDFLRVDNLDEWGGHAGGLATLERVPRAALQVSVVCRHSDVLFIDSFIIALVYLSIYTPYPASGPITLGCYTLAVIVPQANRHIMKKLLFCTLLAATGFVSGYVARDYGEAKTRMTKFANVYECCAGAAMARREYSTHSAELADVAVKGPAEKMSTFDRHRLVVVWRDAGRETLTKDRAPWVTVVEESTQKKIAELLGSANLTSKDVDALAALYSTTALPPKEPTLTKEQHKQMAYLLQRAPDLNLVLTGAQRELYDAVRTHGEPDALLAADPLADVFRSPLDHVALCQVRPDIVTLHKNSTFRECLGQ